MTAVVKFRVNGVEREVAGADAVLLDALRDGLHLKGTKFGCGTEQCGACTVLVDGKPAYACTTALTAVTGKSVKTVEGLGTREAPHPLQAAFIAEQAAQCGYCTAGMLMSAAALLAANPDPGEDEVRAALERNLCRCGTYHRV